MRRLAVCLAVLVVLSGCTAPTPDVPIYQPGGNAPADPASDTLGWEQGLWHNESLPVNVSDGLTHRELNLTVARSMARVEYLRDIEFNRPVKVEIMSRAAYRNRSGTGNTSKALKTFDNVKFEALFLVGERGDSLQQQEENRGTSVLGYYSPSKDRIVIISETRQPTIEETTLGHELVHALQFRNFDPDYERPTRDKVNANSGLIEGDARYVDQQYSARCGDAWNCVSPSATDGGGGGGGGGGLHLGIYLMKYFPYSDGPGFIRHFKQQGGWERVNRLYDHPPATSEQVMTPSKYKQDEPAKVTLKDTSSSAWKRVTPEGRAPYGEVGVGGITAMFAYPAYDNSRSGYVVSPQKFLNLTPDGDVSSTDPINYDIAYTEGWDGERMYIYENSDGDHAYVWRLVWDSPKDAKEFAAGYRDLLRYWGAQETSPGVYRIPEGESNFADAFRVTVDGNTVTIVNAPNERALDDIHAA